MLVIGHGVSYDRARILQEYRLKRGKLRFFGYSLHALRSSWLE